MSKQNGAWMASLEPFSWSNALDNFFVFREKVADRVFRNTIAPPKAHWRSQELSIPFALGHPPSVMDIGWREKGFQ